MSKVSARWCSLILGASVILGTSGSAIAQTLSSATVERLRNRVHLIPSGRNARLARVSDVLSIGDALRTSSSARAQLRFNDGSLARVGEQATFRFTPNTRNFQLSNGTVLLLIPPGRGRTTIQTPNAVTGIQGSALFVRVRCMAELSAEGHCSEPITFVGALTNNPAGAMLAINESGSQQQPIYAGEMVVIEGDDITQLLEFDLKTFYETSGLVEGLGLDEPTPPENLTEDLQDVWQEIQDALELQGDFDSGNSEEIVENPGFIAPAVSLFPDDLGEEAGLENLTLAAFPIFESSPAAVFHNVGSSVATYSSFENHTVTILETLGDSTELDTNVANSRTEVMNSMVERPLAAAPAPITSSAPVSAPVPTVAGRTGSPELSPVAPAPVSAPVPVVSVTPSSPVPNPTPAIVEVPAPTENPAPPAVVEVPNTIETPRAPVAGAPTPPVETPVVTSVVEPPAPVVEAPNPAPVVEAPNPTPVVVETPTPIESPITTPVTEADQIPTPERNELPPEGFDWNNQRPAANDPEILQSPEQLPVNEITAPDGTSAPNIPL